MKVFLSAGEASGDALGAHLIEALAAQVSELDCCGMGGPRMTAAGLRKLRDAGEVGVVGLIEVIRHLPRLFSLVGTLADLAAEERPDVAVLIDVPDFNIRLARRLRALGIPVVFYVGPSVWAWRPGRARRYARYIDKLLVLFPFEVPIWRAAGVDVVCAGHPLLDEIPAPRSTEATARGTVALLPGSRRSEIRRHLAVLLEAAARLLERGLARRFVLPVAPSLDEAEIARQIERSPARGAVELIPSPEGAASARRDAIASSDLALVASGTATLETALVGRPQIVVYRVSWWSWLLMRPFVRVPFLGLVNLIAGREVAPELLQGNFTVPRLVAAAGRLLDDPDRVDAAIRTGEELRQTLGGSGVAARAARAVIEVAGRARDD